MKLTTGFILLLINFANLKNVSLLRFWRVYRFVCVCNQPPHLVRLFFLCVHRNNLLKAEIPWMVTSFATTARDGWRKKSNDRYWNFDRSGKAHSRVTVPEIWFIMGESKSCKTLPVCNCLSVLLSVALVSAWHSQKRIGRYRPKKKSIKMWR